ncbi:MAG: bifunctional transcriptional activator/DNA repair protein Ada [Betaproteobacteria bacterium]|nr:bifunctional transcriptional activator/DNA repair protein Ada [Betaproteobacteria bacterium]
MPNDGFTQQLDDFWAAVLRRDRSYEGQFFLAVKTTGVFCRPGCPARTPQRRNVEFFPDAQAALFAGYRACMRCKPLLASSAAVPLAMELKAWVDADPAARLREQDLRDRGIDPSTARRQFQKAFGMTFHAYQRARRMGAALSTVRQGAPVIDAQLAHGFESASGFRDAFAKVFGAPPSRAAGVRQLLARWIDTPLGAMLAVADDEGLHLIDWVDRRGLERAIGRLKVRLKAAIVPGPHAVLDQAARKMAEYFAGRRRVFTLPLAPQGTPFQNAVWNALVQIPAGETRTYSGLAATLGQPTAVRAVARANGDNFRGIVVPCHRVIGADGNLTGYGGGLARKRWLIEHERRLRVAPGNSGA